MLIHFVLAARLVDGLPLVATMDSSDPPPLEKLKKLVKTLTRKLASAQGAPMDGSARVLPNWCSILANDYTFQWVDCGRGAQDSRY